jgi:hypothetical protein
MVLVVDLQTPGFVGFSNVSTKPYVAERLGVARTLLKPSGCRICRFGDFEIQ